MRLILASASARRAELLKLMGLEFCVSVSGADEDMPPCPPEEAVQRLALRKAEAVQCDLSDCCVVGADTIVCVEGQTLGKPAGAADARRMLRLLSGRTHTVYTGVAVLAGAQTQTCCDAAQVTFAELSEAEIDAYVRTGEPMDKAGAYGIQGAGCVFIERIEGSYFTVMGLPVQKLYQMLRLAGLHPGWQA